MDNILFKRVGRDDYNDVINIRHDIYYGLDYLPALYHKMLQNHHGYAAVIGGEMVAFKFVTTLDDDSTMISRAGRVKHEYEGTGVFQRFNEFVLKCFLHENIQQTVGVVHLNKSADSLIRKGGILTFQRLVLYCSMSSKDITLPDEQDTSINIFQIKQDELTAIFNDENLRKVFFPDERLILDWVPFRLMQTNVKLALTEDFYALQSRKKSTISADRGLLSFSCSYDCALGTRFNIDIYGCPDDCSEFSSHLQKHIEKHRNSFRERCALFLSFHSSIYKDIITNIVTEFGFTIHTDVYEGMFGIEKIQPRNKDVIAKL